MQIARDNSLCKCCCCRRWCHWDWWWRQEEALKWPSQLPFDWLLKIFQYIQTNWYERNSDFQPEDVWDLWCNCKTSSWGTRVGHLQEQNNFEEHWPQKKIGKFHLSCWNLQELLEPIHPSSQGYWDQKKDLPTKNQYFKMKFLMEEAKNQQLQFCWVEIEC